MATAPLPKTTLHLAPPKAFSIQGEPSLLAKRWKEWLASFEIYLEAANVEKDKRKKALLLYIAGTEIQEIYNTLPLASDTNTYTDVVKALNSHFAPSMNYRYERFIFNSCLQKQGESISAYVTRLRKLATTCEFDKIKSCDDIIVDQIIAKCNSHSLRKELLQEPNLTINRVLEIDKSRKEVNKACKSKGQQSFKFYRCFRCGKEGHHPNDKERCPAADRVCNYCGKMGHFQSVCRNREAEEDTTCNPQ
ncbi:uncharacterized protein LOC122251687 [Penaeus japonicus]|uniref:uncharacterized protein LOC122251687 n=1 Tax=Penaeus japonicus TaxID=27405 RepID=UPI001C7135CD|nr:uncharacterized protein LOC122251687 [Penaeus japonicus]